MTTSEKHHILSQDGKRHNDSTKKLGMPSEVVRQHLQADEETKAMAALLGLEVEAYVDIVMGYATAPDRSPMLKVVDEEEAAALGEAYPEEAEVEAWFEDVASGKIEIPDQPLGFATQDGFEAAPSSRTAFDLAGRSGASSDEPDGPAASVQAEAIAPVLPPIGRA